MFNRSMPAFFYQNNIEVKYYVPSSKCRNTVIPRNSGIMFFAAVVFRDKKCFRCYHAERFIVYIFPRYVVSLDILEGESANSP